MLFALNLTEAVQYAVRGGAAVVGLLIGWFAAKPIANVLSRLAFQRPVAKEIMPLIRVIAAVGLAVLFYFLVPAGIGDGFGGGGDGGGVGKDKVSGKGKGGDKSKDKNAKDDADKTGATVDKGKKADDLSPDLVRVEILGGSRYPGMEKWYLFQRKDPPLDKTELQDRIRDFLKTSALKTARLQPVVTSDTLATWRATRVPELEMIRAELGLQPVDPELPKLTPEK